MTIKDWPLLIKAMQICVVVVFLHSLKYYSWLDHAKSNTDDGDGCCCFFYYNNTTGAKKRRGWGFRADVKRRGAHLGHKVETPVSHIWSQNNTPNAVWLSYGCNLFLHPCKMVFISFWIFDLKWCLIGCSLWRSKKCSERNSFRFVVPPTAALKCYTHTHISDQSIVSTLCWRAGRAGRRWPVWWKHCLLLCFLSMAPLRRCNSRTSRHGLI